MSCQSSCNVVQNPTRAQNSAAGRPGTSLSSFSSLSLSLRDQNSLSMFLNGVVVGKTNHFSVQQLCCYTAAGGLPSSFSRRRLVHLVCTRARARVALLSLVLRVGGSSSKGRAKHYAPLFFCCFPISLLFGKSRPFCSCDFLGGLCIAALRQKSLFQFLSSRVKRAVMMG